MTPYTTARTLLPRFGGSRVTTRRPSGNRRRKSAASKLSDGFEAAGWTRGNVTSAVGMRASADHAFLVCVASSPKPTLATMLTAGITESAPDLSIANAHAKSHASTIPACTWSNRRRVMRNSAAGIRARTARRASFDVHAVMAGSYRCHARRQVAQPHVGEVLLNR